MDYSPLIAQVPLIPDSIMAVLHIHIGIIGVILLVVLVLWRKISGSDKLKNEFITIVAHKFRTPLTKERWITENLLAEENDPYKRESLIEVQKANRNLIDLTGTLIEMTETDSASKAMYNFERLPLCEMVRSIGDSLKNSFHEKNIFFAVQCPPEEVYVKVDRTRIEFVIQTILNNAYTYTPPGKNVDITISRSLHKASIAITDHGIGISRADLPYIFSKFFRTKNAQLTDTEGFGVGLYLAKSIMRRLHGKIDVSSEGVDRGTTFTITLKVVR